MHRQAHLRPQMREHLTNMLGPEITGQMFGDTPDDHRRTPDDTAA